jgi:hypothetical protein
MIGRALVPYLLQAGHRVTTLTRGSDGPGTRHWDPDNGVLDLDGIARIDAVIHLAGENVAAGRWTAARKARILASRETSTRLLATTIAALNPRPAAMICASGISAYADDGRPQNESSPLKPAGFLGKVVLAWEAAAQPARDAGIRVAHLRLGAVLSPDGGALGKLAPVFRAGLGGPIGDGSIAFPWIAIDDVIELFHRAAIDDRYTGAINAVSPAATSNADFTRALARVLRRPALLPLPVPIVLALFGQMGKETLLANHQVSSNRLGPLGFAFRFTDPEPALACLLMRLRPSPYRSSL